MHAAPAQLPPLLRQRVYRSVEFSVSDDLRSHSTLVPAGEDLLRDVEQWAGAYAFCDVWLVAVRRLTAGLRPDAALFRIDWTDDVPTAFTWYFRFPAPPGDQEFHAVLRSARPLGWIGPGPQAVATALGVPGPRGVALRVDASGKARSAVYYRVDGSSFREPRAVLPRLLEACGLPGERAEEIERDVAALRPRAGVEVVGIDEGIDAGAVGAVKLDPADVPVTPALRWLASRGATDAVRGRVESMAASLHARTLSYVGLKYAAAGFAGWRAYYSSEPARARAAGSIAVTDRLRTDKSRMPQY
jgi:hypothetical protein